MKELVELKIKPIVIAIDPGVNTGFAVIFDKDNRFFELCTLSIFAAQERVTELVLCLGAENVLVVFEDCRLRKWVNPKFKKERMRGIGSVERDCSIWQEFCERNGLIFHRAHPSDLAGLNTKDDKWLFVEITGHPYDTSEHSRDAGMLARKYHRMLRTGEYVMPARVEPTVKKYPANRKLPKKPDKKVKDPSVKADKVATSKKHTRKARRYGSR